VTPAQKARWSVWSISKSSLKSNSTAPFSRKYIAKLAVKVERQALQEADRAKLD
jgi:hypothetical protein